jgi:hypothetical protein
VQLLDRERQRLAALGRRRARAPSLPGSAGQNALRQLWRSIIRRAHERGSSASRFFRVRTLGPPATRKSSGFSPDFIAAVIHRGLRPGPLQVSEGFVGLRYLGATGPRLARAAFALPLPSKPPAWKALPRAPASSINLVCDRSIDLVPEVLKVGYRHRLEGHTHSPSLKPNRLFRVAQTSENRKSLSSSTRGHAAVVAALAGAAGRAGHRAEADVQPGPLPRPPRTRRRPR